LDNSESVATEQKSDKFLQAIRTFADQRIDTIHKHIAETLQAEIDKQDKLMQVKMRNDIERGVQRAKSEVTRTYAAKEQEMKKDLLLMRQKILDAVFSEARLKLQEFTKTEEYRQFLSESAVKLSDMFTQDDTIFFVKKGDLAHASLITAAFGKPCTVKVERQLLIGGFMAESELLGLVADLSLDSMLKAQQPWFEKNSGLVVV